MFRRVIQFAGAVAVLAVIVLTILGRDGYTSAVCWRKAAAVVTAAPADEKSGIGTPMPDVSVVQPADSLGNTNISAPSPTNGTASISDDVAPADTGMPAADSLAR